MAEFVLDRFIELSRPVRLDDLRWEDAIPLSDGEVRILRYMAATEAHTVLYMRDLLAGYSARDPEIRAFLSVWVYEEFWHGRAIDRLLAAAGHPPRGPAKVPPPSVLKELAEATLSHALAAATPRFAATHMAWGAINELTAAAAYLALERYTTNPLLATLCGRLAKQERKHFSFYYYQANRRLKDDSRAQKICSLALKWFWDIVGSGVADNDALEYLAATLFADEASRRTLTNADETIAQLPGLGWFAMVRPAVEKLVRSYESKHGPTLVSSRLGLPERQEAHG